MERCPSCGVEVREGRAFCSACGKAPKANFSSYVPTLLFLLVALMLALFWAGVKNSN